MVPAAAVLGIFHRQVGPARQAYRQLLQKGLAQGHQDRFYETVGQRFLGDEEFIEEADRKTSATREVTVRPLRIAFGPLLTAMATTCDITPKEILAPGRQRALVPARALFMHLARAWSGLTTRVLGRRLQRDPSMISRLAATYAAHPDSAIEARVRQAVASQTPK